ncbi:uncharacterized protein LOC104905124 isoform X1 [Beta vulgaris subsp. vulgaris]|uniref:uncharacterized protein LOC104905124 isoform X1 n=1 Tax=Beta vulgaris subsp. vulgaris TaxID=3555 RepID=UPI00203734F5|nr:uncharacterized protein LOC104905124 isoform X1 [Beta vulgaris subsp. vulgaris]
MAQVVRAAATPLFHRQILHFLSSQTTITTAHRLSLLSLRRHAHISPRALRPPREIDLEKRNNNNISVVEPKDDKNAEDDKKNQRKSRNEAKRAAREAVRWGIDLASFSTSQIKRILKAASLEEEVFEALMVVKKLGADVREGKRRQFNYIGKLLRDAEPDLLGALIQATKDGDQSRLQAIAGSGKSVDESPEEELDELESEPEEEDEDSGDHVMLGTKWFDGFIKKDIQTSNEVYSIDIVDFDRQELRQLVRKVHSLQDRKNSIEEDANKNAKLMAAKKSLNRFLCSLAKRHLSAQSELV